jgi:hypothetical protein
MAGGGVGEAMLIGAAVGATAGGAGAAIQGGDPLQGALTGGAMGAVGGGLGAGFGAAGGAGAGGAGGVGAGGAGAGAGAGTGASVGAMSGAGSSAGIAGTQAASNLGASISGVGAGSGTLGSTGFGLTAGSGLPTTASSLYGAGAGAGTTGAGFGIAAPTTSASLGGAGAGAGGGAGALPGNFTGYAPQLSNTALGMTAGTAGLAGAMGAERAMYGMPPEEEYDGPLSKFKYDPDKFNPSNPIYAPDSVYRPTYAAEGGIMKLASGGPVERMSQMNTAMNPQGGLYPQGMIDKTQYATPTQRPTSMEVVDAGAQRTFAVGGMVDPYTGMAARQQADQSLSGSQGIDSLMGNKKRMLTKEQMDAVKMQGMSKEAMQDVYGQMAAQGLAKGGTAHLGGYSDGGRMLKGPGDGMSDSIPGVIADKQPARLADGEFVVPADVVSHLGNGSTDAGAKQLYAMMNRVRKARTGNSKQGKQIKPAKYMAA